MPHADLRDLSLADLALAQAVYRTRSLREAARQLRLQPGQASKRLIRLEQQLGIRLFQRSTKGMVSSALAAAFFDIVDRILAQADELSGLNRRTPNSGSRRSLAVSGTTFLVTHLVSAACCQLVQHDDTMHFRFLDLPPDQLTSVGLRGVFDLAVHIGAKAWPRTWQTRSVGKLEWWLCARAAHPLRPKAPLAAVLGYPFVVPTYWTPEGLAPGNDQFPVPLNQRRMGFETTTADAAIPILCNSEQVAFLPAVTARAALVAGLLKRVRPPDLPSVAHDVFLSAKADTVSAKLFDALVARLAAGLAGAT